jgi:hypothetical protein
MSEEFSKQLVALGQCLGVKADHLCLLSRRDSTIEARHEVGDDEENSPVPAGRLNRSWRRKHSLLRLSLRDKNHRPSKRLV